MGMKQVIDMVRKFCFKSPKSDLCDGFAWKRAQPTDLDAEGLKLSFEP